MFFKSNKKNTYKQIEKSVDLILKKLLWLKENKSANTILLAGQNNETVKAISEKLFQKLTEDYDKNFLLLNLGEAVKGPDSIDWDHDLVLCYCEDFSSCPAIYEYSSYIDTSIILVKSGHSNRARIKDMIKGLKDINVSVSGAILHSFKEKIPSIINWIIS